MTLPPVLASRPAPPPTCPVTLPVVAPSPTPDGALFGSDFAYGNAGLWVGALGSGGVIALPPDYVTPDGGIGTKLGWYRITEGKLTITGRRLDGPSPPLRSHVPDGYGPSGFQASGVEFPLPGCWEVTGAVGSTRLTFVTYVVVVAG